MTTHIPVPPMLTPAEVAKLMRCHVKTVYRRPWRYVQDGAKRLYYADDIRLYLHLNTVTPTQKVSR